MEESNVNRQHRAQGLPHAALPNQGQVKWQGAMGKMGPRRSRLSNPFETLPLRFRFQPQISIVVANAATACFHCAQPEPEPKPNPNPVGYSLSAFFRLVSSFLALSYFCFSSTVNTARRGDSVLLCSAKPLVSSPPSTSRQSRTESSSAHQRALLRFATTNLDLEL